jgi:hypothetical protein
MPSFACAGARAAQLCVGRYAVLNKNMGAYMRNGLLDRLVFSPSLSSFWPWSVRSRSRRCRGPGLHIPGTLFSQLLSGRAVYASFNDGGPHDVGRFGLHEFCHLAPLTQVARHGWWPGREGCASLTSRSGPQSGRSRSASAVARTFAPRGVIQAKHPRCGVVVVRSKIVVPIMRVASVCMVLAATALQGKSCMPWLVVWLARVLVLGKPHCPTIRSSGRVEAWLVCV